MSSERRGLLLILSSPSGAGKSTICRRLLADFPQLQTSVSVTTRAPRPGEVDGVHYNFLDRAGFDARVKAGDFLEWAEVHENRYGTPKAPVEAAIAAGRDVLFDIDWQGARDIARQMPNDTVRVFVLPPSMAELARRLHTRAEDAADVIERRLQRARGEIAMWGDYDYVIVNDALEQAYSDVVAIYRAERMRRSRNPWVAQRVAGLISEP
jgi:guanylate kinase